MALSVSIELVSSSARVTSVKSTQGLLVCDGHPDPKIGLGPIKSTQWRKVRYVKKDTVKKSLAKKYTLEKSQAKKYTVEKSQAKSTQWRKVK